MADKPLIIKQRGDDGTRIISLRIKETVLHHVDEVAAETNRSRNEIINMLIEFALENVEIHKRE